jgi:hypothetical protein
MTAKQKANQARFKKVVAEAKKLRKKNPKLTQAQAVKQAWAMTYSKKDVSVGNVPISKYNVGDEVYSYQNKTYKAPIAYLKFVPWEGLSKPNSKDKYVYKLKLKDGYSNYINEESLSKKSIGAMPTKVKAKKGKRTNDMHTDTKSHNVNIRVISGIKENAFKEIVKTKDLILKQNELLKRLQEGYKKSKSKIDKEMTMMDIKTLKNDFIPHNKRYLKSLQIALKKSICK